MNSKTYSVQEAGRTQHTFYDFIYMKCQKKKKNQSIKTDYRLPRSRDRNGE